MSLFYSKVGQFIRIVTLEKRVLTASINVCVKTTWENTTSQNSRHNHTKMSLLKPPDTVRGMTKLSKEAFNLVIRVPYFDVGTRTLKPILNILKPYLFKRPKQTNVTDTSDPQTKRVLINPDKTNPDGSVRFTDSEKDSFKILEFDPNNLKSQEVTLTYDNWTHEEILKSVLPTDLEGASSYSRVGHIIHLNLRSHLSDYRFLIGQVLLDKLSGISLVVNKTQNIDSTYRNFQMETIAGEGSTITTVKENRYSYTFDFAKVYWNPRLSTEHERIIKFLNPADVLFDVFAGVGPFAIPAAKKKCSVFANDLNPDSYNWLSVNAKQNKVQDLVKCYNVDGREFISDTLKNEVVKIWEQCKIESVNNTVHVVMNLPALALEFLDAFDGLFWDYSNALVKDKLSSLKVHVYFFVKGEEVESEARKLVRNKLSLSESVNLEYSYVRHVAPMKEMVRVSFVIPFDVLFNRKNSLSPVSHAVDSAAKRICVETK